MYSIIHRESKKGDAILLSISLLNIDRFHNSFTDVLSCLFFWLMAVEWAGLGLT